MFAKKENHVEKLRVEWPEIYMAKRVIELDVEDSGCIRGYCLHRKKEILSIIDAIPFYNMCMIMG